MLKYIKMKPKTLYRDVKDNANLIKFLLSKDLYTCQMININTCA